ncbi:MULTISPECIES: NYN domain-containing protein [Halomonas]|uniref:NYN domain-containing protein n=2 Tax=Halomonas TaxID=2745 RepID=A0A7X4VYR2_9GAMM|nr:MULTISPECIES: NYN domain-containing protein [Halomonas]MDR5901251.1 NYN domain-containing protein [Halomonas icarae]NAW11528.1 NYN domain-containing protein [Halomonas icarae]TDB05226.1 NYN domain-containing protein [Halomonas marinisediminis]
MERLAIFVDVQNVYYTCRQAFGRHFDYNAFWARFAAGHEIVVANAYAVERGDPRQQRFQTILRAIGFNVKLKPFIQRRDGSAKGDWDVGITLDAMEAGPLVDHVVLVSGDGDFDLLVSRLRDRYGVRVTVVGVSSLSADSLVREASDFVPIEGALLL